MNRRRIIIAVPEGDMLRAMKERQDAADWLQSMGFHKSLAPPVMTSVRYDLTPEEKAAQDAYIKEHGLPF